MCSASAEYLFPEEHGEQTLQIIPYESVKKKKRKTKQKKKIILHDLFKNIFSFSATPLETSNKHLANISPNILHSGENFYVVLCTKEKRILL